MSQPPITVSEWKPRQSGSLRGFCTVQLPSGMILHEVSIHARNGSWWASPASKPMIGKDGTALRDADGKTRNAPVVSFDNKQTRDRLSQSVVEALHRAHPEVFAADG